MSAVTGLPVSVQTRLVRHAREIGVDPNLVLARYAAERFLYRLSQSPHIHRFVLKGASLMLVWLGETIRPTRDVDLLGFGDLSDSSLAQLFREVCLTSVEPDGMTYLSDSVRVAPIREDDAYGGLRATLPARLGNARLRVQVDVGIGDAIDPPPVWLEYPSLLDFARPKLRAYRPETSIAEKLHAMVVLGEANSRMRDFFDVYVMSERLAFDGMVLTRAVTATFQRRRTSIPASVPIAMTPVFAQGPGKQEQWQSYLRKNEISAAPPELADVTLRVAAFLKPVISAARERAPLRMMWNPQGPWKATP